MEHLEAPGPEKKGSFSPFFFLPTVNAYLLLTSLKVCDWPGHIFGASASPRSLAKKMAMSSTVHGGQHDTKYVTFELLMHAAFVSDEIWLFMLEPRTAFQYHTCTMNVYIQVFLRCGFFLRCGLS